METNEIHTLSHEPVPVPTKWIIPGLDNMKGNIDAFKHIIDMVCSKYGLTEEQVMSKSRKKERVKARQIIHSLLRKNFYKLSAKSIGEKCGSKDHATVLHGCKSVSDQVETNKTYREEYKSFDNSIKLNIKRFKQTHLKLVDRQYI